MRLADFILSNIEPILAEWEIFARSIGAGEHLDQLALRDHAQQILQATARDMKSPQTAVERVKKSKGLDLQENDDLDGASKSHAMDRLGLGFDLLDDERVPRTSRQRASTLARQFTRCRRARCR